MSNKKLINKQAKKHLEGKCYFCEETQYELLDCHRIVEGVNGGIYSCFNTVVVCSNCHRKIHAGDIKIDRKYLSTSSKWVLHYWIHGEEVWE